MTNNEQLCVAAIEKLRAAGVSIHEDSKIQTIASAIEKLHGRQRIGMTAPHEIVRNYVAPVAQVRQMAAFKPLRATAHPRLSEIDRAQPPMMTPNGTGNHNQYSKFMLDNGRAR